MFFSAPPHSRSPNSIEADVLVGFLINRIAGPGFFKPSISNLDDRRDDDRRGGNRRVGVLAEHLARPGPGVPKLTPVEWGGGVSFSL